MSRWLLALLLCFPILLGAAEDSEPGLNAATFKGLELRGIGPALMSGRITDIAVDPKDRSIWYVAVGSGGLWKTSNRGVTWDSIFDDQASWSIGTVTVDPNDSNVIWVGSGENVGGRHVGFGDGVYKSLDRGASWENVGLKDSQHIGTILIDPRDSDIVYVAAQGPLWSGGGDRGLFKSTDGGANWEKILGGGEYTGVNEVRMDPRNPDVLYATTHQRLRNVAGLMNGGPESGIHKSTDGGATWRELTKGLPEEDMGRIGLAISPQNPDVVYTTIELKRRTGGFYRSADGGGTWEQMSETIAGGTGPHYYQEIFASPHAFDRVYNTEPGMKVTNDGGKTFATVEGRYQMHSDSHAVVFDPDDADYILVGSDGGIYETFDLGKHWRYSANLPVTQFYKMAVDYDEPFYNIYGGTQDNSTQGGPSRTMDMHGIRNADWFITIFADGHQPAVDPTNPDIVYSEWQRGNLVRYDRRTGEVVYIQPQPAEDEPYDRFNWDSPILISPHDPARLYFASQRVWRSDDRGDSWTALSGDLSRGLDRIALPMMDRVWSYDAAWDLYAMSEYGSITSLSESSLVEGLLYAGTDDGVIQVSEDGGATWRRSTKLPGVADVFFVNDIKADLHDADTVYVAVDHHKDGDFAPYVFKSTDRGRSWKSIASSLPDRHVAWRIVQDHVKPELMFLGTEFGVFFTIDGGGRWVKLEGNAPNISFRDLAIQKRENDLVGATFGRGFYILDDYTPLREVSEAMLDDEATLFPVREADWYIPKRTLGRFGEGHKASQGASYYVAPNPPFGAVFTYYLGEDIQTQQEQRREREKEIEKTGGDTPYPGWDALGEEALEDAPAIVLTVRDSDGQVIRHVEGPVTAGFHRVAWNLRYPSPQAWQPPDSPPPYIPTDGALAPPGSYTVSLGKRTNGQYTDLGQSHSFEVKSIRDPVLSKTDEASAVVFARRVDELRIDSEGVQKAAEELVKTITELKTMLDRSTADANLRAQAHDIERRAKLLRDRVAGNEARGFMGDPGPVPINRRLQIASFGPNANVYGPTATQEQSVNIAEKQLGQATQKMQQLNADMRTLEEALDEAGVPWSPGRTMPGGG